MISPVKYVQNMLEEHRRLLKQAEIIRKYQEKTHSAEDEGSDDDFTPVPNSSMDNNPPILRVRAQSRASLEEDPRIPIKTFNDLTKQKFILGIKISEDYQNLWKEFKTAPLGLIIVASVCSLLKTLMEIAKGVSFGMLTDVFTSSQPAKVESTSSDILTIIMEWRSGLKALIAVLVSLLGEWICSILTDYYFALARANRTLHARSSFFASLIIQDQFFHGRHSSSSLLHRLQRDASSMNEVMIFSIERLLRGSVAVVTVFVMLYQDWSLTVLTLILRLPFALQMVARAVHIASSYETLQIFFTERAVSVSSEALQNVRTIQAFSAESAETRRYVGALARQTEVAKSSALASTVLTHTEGLILILTQVAILAFGGWRIRTGAVTFGQLQAYTSAAGTFISNFHALEALYSSLAKSIVLSRRYFLLRDRRPAVPVERPHPQTIAEEAVCDYHSRLKFQHPLSDLVDLADPNDDEGLPRPRNFVLEKDPKEAVRELVAGCPRDVPAIEFEDVSFSYPQTSLASPGDASSLTTSQLESSTHNNDSKRGPRARRGSIHAPNSQLGRISDPEKLKKRPEPLKRPLRLHQIDKMSFSIPRGSVAAFVGPSGGGKTTLTRLLMRVFDPQSGTVRLFGKRVQDLPLAVLRGGLVVAVEQETVLFDRSLLDNICLGYQPVLGADEPVVPAGGTEISFADAQRVASMAKVEEFARTLPQRYDTRLGERGNRLSGGQRQRVAIARALLRDPEVLVLDESTSALDTTSEKLVSDAIHEAMKGRTVLLIAHRLSTVRHVDIIFVVKDGRVVESGNHVQILKMFPKGVYAQLLKSQGDEDF